jgi:hypothetical protein
VNWQHIATAPRGGAGRLPYKIEQAVAVRSIELHQFCYRAVSSVLNELENVMGGEEGANYPSAIGIRLVSAPSGDRFVSEVAGL